MSTKMGRPKSENPKSIEVKARITPKTYQKIYNYAFEHKISIAATIRTAVDLLCPDENEEK